MIISSQRTIYSLDLQNSIFSGDTYTPKPNTTLNEKYTHLVNEVPGSDTTYGIKYLAIGTGNLTPTSSVGYTYSNHSSLDAALFNQVPFIVRPVNNDITSAERAKYRFRVTKLINGSQYYLYYLKTIPKGDIRRNIYKLNNNRTTQNILGILDFNTANYLNPTPLTGGRVYGVNNEFVTAALKVKFQLTPAEIDEINKGIALLYGPTASTTLTELGVCGGLDKTINGITEAINVQIYFHIGVTIDLQISYDPVSGFLRAMELGGTEPIYV